MNKNTKHLLRIIAVLILFVGAEITFLLTNVPEWTKITVFAVIYLLAGYDVLWEAVTNAFHGSFFDENFLMTVASLCAFTPLVAEYGEAVAVMWLYQVGELFQNYAVGKSRRAVESLLQLAPEKACVLREGALQTVDPKQVVLGETLVVRAGERIALDGTVTNGTSTVDTSAITGESLPKKVAKGDDVLAGTINIAGTIEVQTTSVYTNSTVAKILDLVENATENKSEKERFITKFSRYYTPVIVAFAVMLFVVPSAITGNYALWLKRAMMFLFVSCPCALVISVPLSFFGGIASASKQGILVKGSNYLEILDKVSVIACDKTGTLTKGAFEVTEIVAENGDIDTLMQIASNAEQFSTHPVAVAVCKACAPNKQYYATEIAGKGICAKDENGNTVLCGSTALLSENGVTLPDNVQNGTAVYVAKNNVYLGAIYVCDSLKQDSIKAVNTLQKHGVKVVMLTGDNNKTATEIAQEAGITEYYSQLLPSDKVKIVEQLKKSGKVAFAGDGINDAPVLMTSDVGISMGTLGSDSAVEASDIVLMHDSLLSVCTAKQIAHKTLGIVKQNIAMALGVKFAVLLLSAIGIINSLVLAIFADVGVAVLAIVNALRCLKYKNNRQ